MSCHFLFLRLIAQFMQYSLYLLFCRKASPETLLTFNWIISINVLKDHGGEM